MAEAIAAALAGAAGTGGAAGRPGGESPGGFRAGPAGGPGDEPERASGGEPEGAPGLILHLGAGEGRALDAYLAAGARHVVLLEPEPVAARRLARRIAGRPQVQLHELALAATDGRATLQVLTLAALSSLRAPADLARLMPGLGAVAGVEVATVSPAGLLALLPPEGTAPEVLVIDAPGEEEIAIAGLAAAGALTRFRRILLTAGRTEHYAGSAPADRLRARLEAAGYRLEGADRTDPDRPCLEFVLPEAVRAQGRRLAALEAECDAMQGALAAERAAREAAERGAAEARNAAADGTEAAERAERLQTDLSLALRMQALREADLADLQARHARLLAEKERQDALLAQLTDRLALAARMLQRPDAAPEAEPAPEPVLAARGKGAGGRKRKARKG